MIEKCKQKIETDSGFPMSVQKYGGGGQSVIVPLHWHECVEIIYVAAGEAEIKINDEAAPVKEGGIAVINYAQAHLICAAEGDAELYSVYIPFGFLSCGTGERCRTLYLLPLYLKESFIEPFIYDDSLSLLTREIIKEYNEKAGCYELKIKGLVFSLLASLLRGYGDFGSRYKSKKTRMYDEIVRSVNYIDDNYSAIGLANRLHTVAGLEQSYFIRKFKSVTGMTPAAYINRVRLEKAGDLILFSELSITEIADKTGFDSPNYFTRRYKEAYGVTPLQARTAKKKNKPAN